MKKIHYILNISLFLTFLFAFSACSSNELTTKKQICNSIQSIVKEGYNCKGEIVSVTGAFRGWSGQCKNSPPETRSDWMIEDGGECIYVSGRMPLGSDPLKPQGQIITVTGQIEMDFKGKPFIKLISDR